VVRPNGARKPAFGALSSALGPAAGRVSHVTLSLSRRRSHVLARRSGPVGDYMQMEVFQGSVPRFRATFLLDRFNRFSLSLPSVLGTSGLRVRVSQFSGGPGGSVQRSI